MLGQHIPSGRLRQADIKRRSRHPRPQLFSHQAYVQSLQFLSLVSLASTSTVRVTAAESCRVFVINMRVSRQHCFLALAAAVLVSASFSSAARGRMLLASESPVNSDTVNSILSKGIKIFTFGQNTEIPPPILQGATDLASFSTPFQPSDSYNTKPATILFQCRAVGNQIWTASEYSA